MDNRDQLYVYLASIGAVILLTGIGAGLAASGHIEAAVAIVAPAVTGIFALTQHPFGRPAVNVEQAALVGPVTPAASGNQSTQGETI